MEPGLDINTLVKEKTLQRRVLMTLKLMMLFILRRNHLLGSLKMYQREQSGKAEEVTNWRIHRKSERGRESNNFE